MSSRRHGPLRGIRVVVAGAGLSGLTAARALACEGASVQVLEARDRIGGRVWTFRDAPIAPFHVEMGGEFIDREHNAIRELARNLGLRLMRVLRRGFGCALERRRRVRVFQKQARLWKELTDTLQPAAEAFEEADQQWGSTAAAAIARHSLRDILQAANATPRLQLFATALRGLWLADPKDLSALVAVEQTLGGGDPGQVAMYRIDGGVGRLVEALEKDARCRVRLRHAVRAIRQDDASVQVTAEGPDGRSGQIRADYFVATAPASQVQTWRFFPALPKPQQRALAALRYGPATKVLLRFSDRWWRRPGRPRAFGSNLSIGAVWESAEEQDKASCLTLLAGGDASAMLQGILKRDGAAGITKRLRWLGGGPTEQPAWTSVTWENDEWARGGYAYFSPSFDPMLRDFLSRGVGRIVFAGDHTSREYQGYMNGAVESGLRAASEISGLEKIRRMAN